MNKNGNGNFVLAVASTNTEKSPTQMAFAQKVVKKLNRKLLFTELITFADKGKEFAFLENVRGENLILIKNYYGNPIESTFDLLLALDAAKRSGAKSVTVIVPYYEFGRSDKKDRPRVSIGSKLVADLLLAAGIDRIITMDLHAAQIQAFFPASDNIYPSTLFVPYIKNLGNNVVIGAPDAGGGKRAHKYSEFLGLPRISCEKIRSGANQIESISVLGNVKGKDVVLIDDMIDTAGTICAVADSLFKLGAKSVRVMATHGVFSGPAYERIRNSKITEVIVTDTTVPPDNMPDKITILSVSDLFAKVISCLETGESVSSLFLF